MPENPIYYTEGEKTYYAVPLASQHLPLELPPVSSYKTAEGSTTPLQNADKSWLHVRLNLKTGIIEPANGELSDEWIEGTRETNTMPQWAGSCWYYLRYLSPKFNEAFVDKNELDFVTQKLI